MTLRRRARNADGTPRRTKYAKRVRDTDFMLWVKTLPCSAMGLSPCAGPIEADHAGARGMSQKADDHTCIPLCSKHHAERTAFMGVFKTWDRERMRAFLADAVEQTQARRSALDEQIALLAPAMVASRAETEEGSVVLDLMLKLVTAVVFLTALLVRPPRARCPQTWHVEGVRSDGAFTCRPAPVGDDELGPHGERARSLQPPGEVGGQIYCTGGTRPIVVNERTVGCQRGGWQ